MIKSFKKVMNMMKRATFKNQNQVWTYYQNIIKKQYLQLSLLLILIFLHSQVNFHRLTWWMSLIFHRVVLIFLGIQNLWVNRNFTIWRWKANVQGWESIQLWTDINLERSRKLELLCNWIRKQSICRISDTSKESFLSWMKIWK